VDLDPPLLVKKVRAATVNTDRVYEFIPIN
jgi:hypothetical protein